MPMLMVILCILGLLSCNPNNDTHQLKNIEQVSDTIKTDTLRAYVNWDKNGFKVIKKGKGETQEKIIQYEKITIKLLQFQYSDNSAVASPFSYKNRFIYINSSCLDIDKYFYSKYKKELSEVMYFPAQDLVIMKDGKYSILKIRIAQAGCSGDACFDYETVEVKFNEIEAKIVDSKGEYFEGSLKYPS